MTIEIHSFRPHKYKVQDDYFFNPNINNCYWAGFIAADGCIQQGSKYLTFGLQEKDLYILENFKKDLQFTGIISTTRKKMGRRVFKGNIIKINSPLICKDLKENFNIIPKKSLVLLPPKIVDKYYIKSFIIGYIDGDGTVDGHHGARLRIVGTHEVLTWMSKFFNQEYQIGVKNLQKTRNIWVLSIHTQQAMAVLKDLYKHPVQKLERKWNKIPIMEANYELRKAQFQYNPKCSITGRFISPAQATN